MPLTGEEIRQRLAELAERWSVYEGSERAEAQTFLNELFDCYGTIDEKSRIYPPVVVESGATVQDSVLRGPLVIGRDTAIVNSYMGPNTSIGPRCRIVGCRIEDSIVMEDSRLEHLHWPVAKSMIGRFVELQGGHNAGGVYSLTLGDHSRIEMPDG